MNVHLKKETGLSLIELTILIVVIGILTAIAMQSMTGIVQDARQVATEQEMEMLMHAIVGNPNLTSQGVRTDFGYVGDVGTFPPDLKALYENPGGFSTWKGPYFEGGFSQDSTGFKIDAWGRAYTYSGGITITSTGSGSTITKKIADATSDYLLNSIHGTIFDADNLRPGSVYDDSIVVEITIPDGSGSTITKVYQPDSTGSFTLDSLPVGHHQLDIIYTPALDTLHRYVTILPRQKGNSSYKFATAWFLHADTLRPDGVGSITELATTGCSDNWECVDEIISDDDVTRLYRASGSYATDVYTIEDPIDTLGTITGVTVYCRARKDHAQGEIRPTLYINGIEYNGDEYQMTSSYLEYSSLWSTNPNTGLDWTWTDVYNLQGGLALAGQNASKPGYCTQIWIIVEYTNW